MRTMYELVPVLKDISRALTKFSRIERIPFEFGVDMELHPAEVHFVSTVVGLGTAGVTELAEEVGVTKGAVSQMAAKLVKKGLVEKEADPENGSKVIISATESGKLLDQKHREFHLKHDSAFIEYLAGLSEEEFKVVTELCKRMDQWMDTYLE